jgi:hypothetical protein
MNIPLSPALQHYLLRYPLAHLPLATNPALRPEIWNVLWDECAPPRASYDTAWYDCIANLVARPLQGAQRGCVIEAIHTHSRRGVALHTRGEFFTHNYLTPDERRLFVGVPLHPHVQEHLLVHYYDDHDLQKCLLPYYDPLQAMRAASWLPSDVLPMDELVESILRVMDDPLLGAHNDTAESLRRVAIRRPLARVAIWNLGKKAPHSDVHQEALALLQKSGNETSHIQEVVWGWSEPRERTMGVLAGPAAMVASATKLDEDALRVLFDLAYSSAVSGVSFDCLLETSSSLLSSKKPSPRSHRSVPSPSS